MKYLEIDNISYIYPNGHRALENISLSFDKKESVAIIGQNGAGKTTLSKLINKLLTVSEGDIFIDGKSTKNLSTATVARKVGYVFQNPDEQIFQDSIFNEIAYALKLLRYPKEEIKRRVEEVAEICGLAGYLSEHPYNLPYSKRKFITIAAVLVMDTDIIILDEPTAGQDINSIKRLGKILDYLKNKEKIVITITHDMEFVAEYFDRVIVMANRKKLIDSNPKEIFWNKEILKEASLKPPYICELAELMEVKDIISIDELLKKER